MGNIHREVRPKSRISRFFREPRAVKIISRHHPRSPHLKKFFSIILIIVSV